MSDEQDSSEGDSMRNTGARKQSLYFPATMLLEIRREATRVDRSLSWVVQRAWKRARLEIASIPGANATKDDD